MILRELKTIAKSNHMKLFVLSMMFLVIAGSGCGVSQKSPSNHVMQASENGVDEDFDLFEEELAEQAVEIADPLEGLNRLMFNINDVLYFWVLKPCAEVYKAILPKASRISVHNFFHNLTTPVRYVNCLLQGKGKSAGTELDRFLINSTVGILGFGDPALDKWKIEPVEEDLGQTLAVCGYGDGFYLVLPLFGPSTLRDSIGMIGDLFLNPVSYVEPVEASVGVASVKITNKYSFHIGEYELLKQEALDPYVAMREIYIQYRRKQIQE